MRHCCCGSIGIGRGSCIVIVSRFTTALAAGYVTNAVNALGKIINNDAANIMEENRMAEHFHGFRSVQKGIVIFRNGGIFYKIIMEQEGCNARTSIETAESSIVYQIFRSVNLGQTRFIDEGTAI
jgi:hypothetical protein